MGFFTPDDDHPGEVILVATGVGIAPLRAIAGELLGRGSAGAVTLFWGARGARDLFWHRELEALAAADRRFGYRPVLSEPERGWTGETGYVTDKVLAAVRAAREPTCYLCGHGQMIEDVKGGLEAEDLGARVRTEVFTPAARKLAG
jgi:NAD(P)H-flavin reductase